MQLVLLEKIRNLGNLGDIVHVKPGYGLNFLIPQGSALPATKANVANFETRRVELEKRAQDVLSQAQQRAEALSQLVVEIAALSGEEGKLYGSVGTREISEAINKAGVVVEKSEVLLPLGAFRFLGEYEVELQLHSDVMAKVNIKIVSAQ